MCKNPQERATYYDKIIEFFPKSYSIASDLFFYLIDFVSNLNLHEEAITGNTFQRRDSLSNENVWSGEFVVRRVDQIEEFL